MCDNICTVLKKAMSAKWGMCMCVTITLPVILETAACSAEWFKQFTWLIGLIFFLAFHQCELFGERCI